MSETRTIRVSGFGRRGTGTYQKDGTASVSLDDVLWLSGNCRINGDRICVTYPQTGTNCYRLQKTTGSTYHLFLNGGDPSVVWEVVK